MKDIFEELREKVDGLVGNSFRDVPAAVPYLKKLFTEEYARVYIAMEDRFQPVEEVAERLGRSGDEVRPILDEMADKGLVMTTTKIDPVFYAPFPFLTGFGDWTAYYEDAETAQAMLAYMQQFDSQVGGQKPSPFGPSPFTKRFRTTRPLRLRRRPEGYRERQKYLCRELLLRPPPQERGSSYNRTPGAVLPFWCVGRLPDREGVRKKGFAGRGLTNPGQMQGGRSCSECLGPAQPCLHMQLP